MTSPTIKFHGIRGGANTVHRGDLHWPGTSQGIPFRGRVPDLTQDEYDSLPIVQDYHARDFCLWVAEDRQQLEEIMAAAQTSWYVVKKRVEKIVDVKDVPGGTGLWVHLEWLQLYAERGRDRFQQERGSHGQIVPIERLAQRSRLV